MRHIVKAVCPVIFIVFVLSTCASVTALAAQEETMMGAVIKRGNGFIIETDDGEYIVKGKDLSKFVGKLVIATGIIKESPKGDVIELKTIEDIQDAAQGD